MKKAVEKKIEGRKEKSGVNFTVNRELDKDSKKIIFPKKLEVANKLLACMQHPA